VKNHGSAVRGLAIASTKATRLVTIASSFPTSGRRHVFEPAHRLSRHRPAGDGRPGRAQGAAAAAFGIAGTADAAFFVTLDAGRYVITGDIRTTSASNKNFNLTGVTLTSGTASDSFENHGSNDYFENPYTLTLTGSTKLLLAVDTNDKAKGAYAGSLTIAEVPLAQPVSEPATAAFLLAGVGLLGISARRRRL
jgi:hypothetical protein